MLGQFRVLQLTIPLYVDALISMASAFTKTTLWLMPLITERGVPKFFVQMCWIFSNVEVIFIKANLSKASLR